MSRYRPPRPKSSPYITAAGARKLEQELKQLWKVERPKVTAAVHEAAKNGDRSENGDYIYGKKRLREIDSRVRYLSKRLDELVIVDRIPDNHEQIFFGAIVFLEDDQGIDHCYRIVGADEIDPGRNRISIDSPLARALLKKTIGDDISVTTPNGVNNYYVTDVRYDSSAE